MLRIIIFLTFIATLLPSATATTYSNITLDNATNNMGNPILGTNLSSVIYYSSEYVFVDAFKMANEWIPQDINGMQTSEFDQLDLDENGWVKSLPDSGDPDVDYRFVATVMLWDIGTHFPQGDYTILYDGEGTLDVSFAGERVSYDLFLLAKQREQLPSNSYLISPDGDYVTYLFPAKKQDTVATPGRMVVATPPENNGIFMRITETDPNDTGEYIRNIRAIMPDFEDVYETEPFHPDFLDMLAPYQVIRFMDWMRTNETTQQAWENRAHDTDYTYGTHKGTPVETMVDLANRLEVDPWFTLPHEATDAYMAEFAGIIKTTLNDNLDVYIEYSNEVWNGGFPQGDWVQAQAIVQWDDDGYSDYSKRMNWYGMRSAEMCDIWQTEWGIDNDRLHCVVGGQATVSWYMETHILPCPLWADAPCSDHGLSDIAIAPYIGNYIAAPENEAAITAWLDESDGGFDSLFTELLVGGVLTGTTAPDGAVAAAIANVEDYMVVSQSSGLPLVAYEGGQHLVGYGGVQNNPLIADFLSEANRQPRMEEAYTAYLEGWQTASLGGLLVHFSSSGRYTQHGSWGAMEYLDEGVTPKYSALMTYRNTALDRQIFLPVVNR